MQVIFDVNIEHQITDKEIYTLIYFNQWRNSYELYRARTRGTQTIWLLGGHPDLSCPGALFIQFPFRIAIQLNQLH